MQNSLAKSQRIGIMFLVRNKHGGITVYSKIGTAWNVPENLVRCALGEEDMLYLLKARTDESCCFSVVESEWKDFCEYGNT